MLLSDLITFFTSFFFAVCMGEMCDPATLAHHDSLLVVLKAAMLGFLIAAC